MKQRRIITLAVIGIAITVGLFWFMTTTGSANADHKLRTALIQNGLIIDSLQAVSSKTPAAASQHQTIAAALKDNLEQLQKLSSKRFSVAQTTQLEQLVQTEQSVLDIYNKDLGILEKVLTYNPADDIGPSVSASQVASRAFVASNGIGQVLKKDIGPNKLTIVSGEISLSKQAESALSSSKDCLLSLSKGKATPTTCILLYSSARQYLNNDLLALWNSSELQTVRHNTTKLVAYLAPAN